MSTAADYILTSYQPDFAVLEDGRLVGIVTREEVLHALARGNADLSVAAVMRRVELRVETELELDEVRQRMGDLNTRVAAVYAGEEYRGLISIEDIAEAYPLAALRRRQALPQGGPA